MFLEPSGEQHHNQDDSQDSTDAHAAALVRPLKHQPTTAEQDDYTIRIKSRFMRAS